MRAWAFLLSFYLVFGQIYYAHSALPVAVATAKGVGTLVRSGVIMHGAGALARSSYKWCKANKVKCAGFLGGAYDLIMGDDDDDNATCRYRFAINPSDTPKSASQTYAQILDNLSNNYPNFDYKNHPKHNEQINKFIAEHKELVKRNPNAVSKDDNWNVVRLDNTYYFSRYKYSDDMTYHEFPHSITMFANCSGNKDNDAYDDDDEQRRKREKELWDKLKDKLSDDDITNIVNNYGDDIDIDKYCASGATCYFLENEFEKEINNNDYDIDKVTNDNCNTRNGKIYSCPNAKKKKDKDDDDDGQTNNDDKKDDDKKDDGQTDDKDSLPIPKIPTFVMPDFCTWAKWFCDDEVKKTDGDINIDNDDLPADSVNINFGGGCPSSHNFPFRLGGYTFTFTMSYTYICQIAQSMGFIVKVLSTIVATYILLGIKS